MRFFLSLLLAAWSVQPARADVPNVVTDIAPVHGLVSRVMQGIGTPDLILPPGASPHGYAMRPSEARALSAADVVFWVGPALSPWLAEPLETLAPDAEHVAFMEGAGVALLPFREGALFEAHAEHDHGNHGHDDHDAETEARDPHVWLDPHNAVAFVGMVATHLGTADPANAEGYKTNAAQARAEILEAEARIASLLAQVTDTPFVVFHDAYHYFESHFGIEASAAISLADGGGASAARLAEVRDRIASLGVSCVLTEPQAQNGLVDAVMETQVATIREVDPLGREIPLGSDFYTALLNHVAGAFHDCLAK
ncbi:zinc ABC transporter substrate-binding protein [Roseobacter sp. YSTF-M11]|uniref:High-affinity zinc uptake system protein ZnuA n=1 Tax=Roseobacter insulae TaxID=2859783 RepID=A0A9X1FZC9_9RHOB|nr:zinc ABC transporter substrate-binding protein [Roseobacter insulae]MBW4710162.1 zinc ABC transporter substrate-binding protein [Roseobacter insulae]